MRRPWERKLGDECQSVSGVSPRKALREIREEGFREGARQNNVTTRLQEGRFAVVRASFPLLDAPALRRVHTPHTTDTSILHRAPLLPIHLHPHDTTLRPHVLRPPLRHISLGLPPPLKRPPALPPNTPLESPPPRTRCCLIAFHIQPKRSKSADRDILIAGRHGAPSCTIPDSLILLAAIPHRPNRLPPPLPSRPRPPAVQPPSISLPASPSAIRHPLSPQRQHRRPPLALV